MSYGLIQYYLQYVNVYTNITCMTMYESITVTSTQVLTLQAFTSFAPQPRPQVV